MWNELEDHVLDRSAALNSNVSILNGPVLRDDDRLYRGMVRLPREFWKVAVLVNAESGKLSATGYVLSQGEMIKDVTEAAFVCGLASVGAVRGPGMSSLPQRLATIALRIDSIQIPSFAA